MSTTTPTELADKLLLFLRERTTAVPLQTLEKKFHVDTKELRSAFKQISGWGYKLKAMRGIVRFIKVPDSLTPTEIHYRLRSKIIGKTAHCFRSVKSTNDLAAQLADEGAPDGTIVTAERQTRGRGRFGRTWHSPENTGIYVSIILRPPFPPEKAPGLSPMTALALADTLSGYCPGEVRIKWPNDVLLSGKKVAGILTELSAEQSRISYVILGVGINVNQTSADFPEELRRLAISLRRVTKKPVNRAELLRGFLYRLEQEYTRYRKNGLRSSHKRLREYSSMLGQTVRLRSGTHVVEGKAVDIDTNGALILEVNGVRTRISAGEITVVKESH